MYAYQAQLGRARRTACLVSSEMRSEAPRSGPRTGSRSDAFTARTVALRDLASIRRTALVSRHAIQDQTSSLRLERASALQGREAIPRRLSGRHTLVLRAARRRPCRPGVPLVERAARDRAKHVRLRRRGARSD